MGTGSRWWALTVVNVFSATELYAFKWSKGKFCYVHFATVTQTAMGRKQKLFSEKKFLKGKMTIDNLRERTRVWVCHLPHGA